MTQSKTYAFVDTNVLLHYTFFKDVDWAEELGVPGVVMVFAPVVLAEIDRHQFAGSRREKKRAQAVVRALDELELGAEPVAVRDNVWALGLAYEPASETYGRWQLNRDVQDDRLLAALLSFRETAGAGHRVLILTADTGLRRTKAPARQVEAHKPSDKLRSPDEPDEVEKGLESARRELAALKSATPDMAVTFDGERVLSVPFATRGTRKAIDATSTIRASARSIASQSTICSVVSARSASRCRMTRSSIGSIVRTFIFTSDASDEATRVGRIGFLGFKVRALASPAPNQERGKDINHQVRVHIHKH